jgi:hypothetical protein
MAGLPPQEVKDLLHKLSTESTKVRATFFNSASSIAVTLSGPLQFLEDGRFAVYSGGDLDPRSSGLVEGLTMLAPTLLSAPCEFLDPRDFANTPFAGFFTITACFDFGLVFILPGGSMLALMSIAS